VKRLARERFQNQEVERSLEEIGRLRHGLTSIPRLSTIASASIVGNRRRGQAAE
jgi:hypothetical protein